MEAFGVHWHERLRGQFCNSFAKETQNKKINGAFTSRAQDKDKRSYRRRGKKAIAPVMPADFLATSSEEQGTTSSENHDRDVRLVLKNTFLELVCTAASPTEKSYVRSRSLPVVRLSGEEEEEEKTEGRRAFRRGDDWRDPVCVAAQATQPGVPAVREPDSRHCARHRSRRAKCLRVALL
eukprot:TRINITY_DN13607_c0_g2_i2.p1 TRINITY_DN13607_c0_g2~~TRINITY_DN13607_c0_g2_i2.p1  ORF type:complete len:196 (+),score=31.82 TRINITY_DN13607_c0_g2_i2:49-588(+)